MATNAINGFDPDNTLFLVDGQGYIYRAYYAIRRLSTADGRSTNAVYGFTTMLLKVLKELRPKHLGIGFDVGGETFRHRLYPAYKANRSAPPEDLPAQIPLIHDVVRAFHIPLLSKPGWEADDLIGTVAREARAKGMKVVIITGDKDFMQLVSDDLCLLDEMRLSRGKEGNVVSFAEVDAKFGVPPERVVDVLALAGDSSDNIPGVKGVGEKTAAALVAAHGDLEGVLAAAPKIKQQKRRENLMEGADSARLARKLVCIDTHADFHVELQDLAYEGPDRAKLRAMFEDLEFKRLLDDPVVKSPEDARGAGPLFERPAEEKAKEDQAPAQEVSIDRGRYREVTTSDDLTALVRDVEGADVVSVHVEAEDGGRTLTGALVGMALSWAEGEAAYIPLGHDDEVVPEQLSLADVRAALSPLLSAPARKVVGHNAKDALTSLVAAGFAPFEVAGDPEVEHYLLDVEGRSHALPELSRQYLQHAPVERDALLGKGRSQVSLRTIVTERATEYAAEHADLSRRLTLLLADRVEQRQMGALYRDLELPLERVLSRMEQAGVRVDSERLASMGGEFETDLQRIEAKAYELAGGPFNLGSPKQVAELLFEKLKLPILKRTATGPSTDSGVLEELKGRHDVCGVILEHRVVSKLKNTYVDVLPRLVHPKTGRVHTHFNQTMAATGRLSSYDPNLQNIPIRSELGRRIREAFVAEDGYVLASLDYSQIELRILAHVTRDPVLLDTFENDLDVHARTASEVFDVPLEQVTREQRTASKAINFGLLYGMGVLRLSRELGIKRSEAKEYLDKYFLRLVRVKEWHADALAEAREQGEVRTLFGRRRLLPELNSQNRGEVARAERLAINTPIQGSAADLIKRAMLRADRELAAKVPDARLILQVHDELLVEVPEAQAEQAVAVVKDAMEHAAELAVPLRVDAGTARSWADAH